MDKTVVELFAGVGGFRVGFNHVERIDNNGKAIEKDRFNFVWANQWEPATKTQPAFECYVKRFGYSKNHVNRDIAKVDAGEIPDHSVLVGGFPCQDYSVARSLSGEKGIQGKKGVLFWEIVRIVKEKKTPFILLENVDRLLISPSKQRGRDFGIMLRALSDLGYLVEWRVINAADYGHPQRRRRVFIFASRYTTDYYKRMKKLEKESILLDRGIFISVFPYDTASKTRESRKLCEYNDLLAVSNNFKYDFDNSGVCFADVFITSQLTHNSSINYQLENLLQDSVEDNSLFLSAKQIDQFEFLKGGKKILRTSANGSHYYYSEGGMAFPDNSALPARTMLTSEGSINRSTHIVKDNSTGKLRKLSPVECERINEFPDDWTNVGMSKNQRYFMMGNSLVCGVVKKLGNQIYSIIDKEN